MALRHLHFHIEEKVVFVCIPGNRFSLVHWFCPTEVGSAHSRGMLHRNIWTYRGRYAYMQSYAGYTHTAHTHTTCMHVTVMLCECMHWFQLTLSLLLHVHLQNVFESLLQLSSTLQLRLCPCIYMRWHLLWKHQRKNCTWSHVDFCSSNSYCVKLQT